MLRSRPLRHRSLLCFALFVAVLGLAGPTRAGDDPVRKGSVADDAVSASSSDVTHAPVIHGQLNFRKSKGDADLLVIRVGVTPVFLRGAEQSDLRKLNRKYVGVRGVLELDQGVQYLNVAKGAAITEQQTSTVAGTVRKPGDKKKRGLELVHADGTVFDLLGKHGKQAKPFVGKHVEVDGLLVRGPKLGEAAPYAALEAVKDVRRKLLPGERDPQSGAAAITGPWSGKLIATRVPSGVPNAKPGDAFAIAFMIEAPDAANGKASKKKDALGKTTGRLFDTYDINGAQLRKYGAKDRSAKLELSYTFGKGDFALTLEGRFSDDWKTYEGTWTSGFLGEGTFKLTFFTPK